ncbi:hypothetical protein P7K49_018452 [Saguinus oedipus]|uniref:Potassium channel subfamily K member 13 n=1 Tax=Saguinus oedipus TaxID=9490 RepID=A0ABQ9V5S7_SAGOE|nr:hypothetical protein P7K49_018452 [Saguinus oedipus]
MKWGMPSRSPRPGKTLECTRQPSLGGRDGTLQGQGLMASGALPAPSLGLPLLKRGWPAVRAWSGRSLLVAAEDAPEQDPQTEGALAWARRGRLPGRDDPNFFRSLPSAQWMRSVGARRGGRSPRTQLGTAPLSVRLPWTRSTPKPWQQIRHLQGQPTDTRVVAVGGLRNDSQGKKYPGAPLTVRLPDPRDLLFGATRVSSSLPRRRATPPPLSEPDWKPGWKRRPHPSAKQAWTLRPLPGTFSVKENSEESVGSGGEQRQQSGFETRSQGGRGELEPQKRPRRRPGEPRGLRSLAACGSAWRLWASRRSRLSAKPLFPGVVGLGAAPGGPTMASRGFSWSSGHLNEDNARFLLLAALIVLYLLGGAAVFSALELAHERQAKQRWEERLANFSRGHNLSRDELRGFLRHYEEATRAGIRVDNARPRWDFAGAFYFVGTVVSTIGKCPGRTR